MKNLNPKVIAFESAIDSGIVSEECLAFWPQAPIFLKLISDGNWKTAEEFCRELFRETADLQIRAFALQLGVGICEIRFHLKDRARWMKLWAEIPEWNKDHYCRFIRHFQEALLPFFNGSLLESERRFKTLQAMAEEIGYQRGLMRVLFHLGLIYRDLDQVKDSKKFFGLADNLAVTSHAKAYREKILFQLGRAESKGLEPKMSIDPLEKIDSFLAKAEKALLKGDYRKARKALISAEIIRREYRISRGGCSIRIYFLLYQSLNGKENVKNIARISDPLEQKLYLNLKERIKVLDDFEQSMLEGISVLLGVSQKTSEKNDAAGIVLCGVSLHTVRHRETAKLVEVLLENASGLTKEELSRSVFGLSYDAFIHDTKIYKLIHRAKMTFNRSDLFLNTYGGYQLNPKYLGNKFSCA